MKNNFHCPHQLMLAVLTLSSFVSSSRAQEVSIPDPNLNTVVRAALQKPTGPITQTDMLGLTNLSAIFRNITNMQGLEAAQNLISLDLQDNRITDASVITNLTKLALLDLSENRFPQLTLPRLTNLATLRLENGRLTNLTFSAGLTKLTSLRVGFNQLSDLALPADATNLTELSAFQNQLTNVTLPPSLPNLSALNLDGNLLSRLVLPAGLTQLSFIALGGNRLTSFTVPPEMTNLAALRINDNQLTNLTLSSGFSHLSLLVASRNPLGNLTLPPGLTALTILELNSDQLSNLTLPPDMQQLIALFLADNPLATLVLSEPLASAGMASVVDSFRREGIAVFTYPVTVKLTRPLALVGSFQIEITGPPGIYSVLASTNLATWSVVGATTNSLGGVIFHDVTSNLLPQNFYRALLQVPPTSDSK